jgi:hypothetical protein
MQCHPHATKYLRSATCVRACVCVRVCMCVSEYVCVHVCVSEWVCECLNSKISHKIEYYFNFLLWMWGLVLPAWLFPWKNTGSGMVTKILFDISHIHKLTIAHPHPPPPPNHYTHTHFHTHTHTLSLTHTRAHTHTQLSCHCLYWKYYRSFGGQVYGIQYQSGSFSLVNVGSGIRCLYIFNFFY